MHGGARGPPPVGAMGRQVQSAPASNKVYSKLKLFLEFPTIPIIYLNNKINITKYGHF